MRPILWHVAAAGADHDRELTLVVEERRDAREVHVVVRADHAGDLLVEEHRVLRCLHPGLGDVVGVVETDGQELPGLDGRQQADLVKGMLFVRIGPVDDVPVADDAGARAGAGVVAAELHEDISGMSTGACSGA